jgi:hypothetical protein
MLSRPYIAIASLILGIFAISANIAWLNPDPDYVVKTNEKIPIMWQYNGDATVEFLSGAYFPEYFRVDKTRINRPAYPLLVKIFGEVYGLIAKPFYELGILARAMLGYITLKLLVYLAGALALYHISRRWFSAEASLLAVSLLLLHPFAITYIATFHTSELQFFTPIFLIFFWLNLSDRYSHKKNILFSLAAGALMLAKQNYAIYLAILLFSFFFLKRYKESVLSFLVHLVPLAGWLIALKMLGIPYYNHESASGLGVWLYQDLIHRSPIGILQSLALGTNAWLIAFFGFFSFFAIAALYAPYLPTVREKFSRSHLSFLAIFISMSWLQTFAANRYASYMVSDLSVYIFPLAACAILALLTEHRLKKLLPLFLALYLAIGLSTIVSFPWVHPYDQKGITNPDRVKLLEEGKLVPRN